MKKLFKYVLVGLAIACSATAVNAEELSRTDVTQDGINAALTAVDAGSDTALNDERTFIVASDTSANGSTVTITAQRTSTSVNGYGTLDISDITISVSEGDSYVIAPTLAYNNDNGRIELSYSGDTTDLDVGVFKRPRD